MSRVLAGSLAKNLLKNHLIVATTTRCYHNNCIIIMRSLITTTPHKTLRYYSSVDTRAVYDKDKGKTVTAVDDDNDEDSDDDKPITYTTSRAFEHKAYQNWRHSEKEVAEQLPYEWPIILCSMIAFMVYFFYLRESNDIDELLGQTLFQTQPEIGVMLMRKEIERHEKLGLDTTTLRAKLDELERLKSTVQQKSI